MLMMLYPLWHICFSLALFPNLLLLYLNIKKQKVFGKPFTLLMIDVIIGDIIISVGSWLAMACGIRNISSQATVYFGYCGFLGANFCYHSQRIAQHGVFYNIFVVLGSFVVRKGILKQKPFRRRHAVLVGVFAYIPALITLILQYQIKRDVGYVNATDALVETLDLPPDRPFPYSNVFAISSIVGSFLIVFQTSLTLISLIGALILRRHLIALIKSISPSSMSVNTRKLNVAFVKSLTFQACIPLLSVLSSVVFVGLQSLPESILSSPTVNSFSFMVNILIPSLNSCTALLIIPSHRKSILGLFKRQTVGTTTFGAVTSEAKSIQSISGTRSARKTKMYG